MTSPAGSAVAILAERNLRSIPMMGSSSSPRSSAITRSGRISSHKWYLRVCPTTPATIPDVSTTISSAFGLATSTNVATATTCGSTTP